MVNNNTSLYEIDNPIVINSTTQATSSSAGSFVTLGGIGIAKNAFIGGNLAAIGTTTGSQLISTITSGTAPLVITSTSVVSNLNANYLNGATFSSPGIIGNTTPSTGAFTSVSLVSPLAVIYGGTGSSTSTGSGSTVLANTPTFVTPNIGVASGTSLTVSGSLTSTVATGTPPLQVTSTTNVPNLNVSLLNGNTFSSPGAVGNTTPSTGAFTSVTLVSPLAVTSGGTGSNISTGVGALVLQTSPTLTTPNIGVATGTSLSVSGSIISTIATGTAPLVVSSTTNVQNLNASLLNGHTFTSPGVIGSTTASTGNFTNINLSGYIQTANPRLYVYLSSNFTPAGYNADYPVYFNTVVTDNVSGYNTGNGAYSPNVAGYYMVTTWATSGTGAGMGIGIFKNGVSGRYSGGYNSGYLAANTSSIVYLNGTAGDYIQILVNLPSGYIYGAIGSNNFCMFLLG
jgi:hypothetical protein